MRAYLETRSQPAKGSFPNQGPDTYIAVQVVPNGVEPLTVLNRNVATRRGIKIIHCGEGYRDRQQTNRSMLGAAREEAQRIVDTINENSDLIQSIVDCNN